MRAVILAAGRGSRMGQLTADSPKCLVTLAGKTLLDRQLAALSAGGATELGIVRGYRAEMLRRPGVVCFDNPRWDETNMVMSLAAAEAWLTTAPLIVSYGDIFYRRELVRALTAARGDLVITYDPSWYQLWSRRFEDPLSDAETFRIDGSGHLLEIGRKTHNPDAIQGQYMGLLKFTPSAWQKIAALLTALDPETCDHLDMTGLLRRLLAFGYQIDTVCTTGNWGEVDSPGDLDLYETMARNGQILLDE
ncbi:MAG TPA: phosphocholine cytidylyltransferase family protein [Acetobacteraceae bacterium]